MWQIHNPSDGAGGIKEAWGGCRTDPDARTIQRTKAGVRVAALSAATRYLHAPASVGSIADFENMLKLTRLFLNEIAERSE